MKRLVIFASGSGTNAENIIRYFQANGKAIVEAVFCNNPKAGVIERAERLHTRCVIFNRKDFYESDQIESVLENINPDLIILAGFLWLIPEKMIMKFSGKIVNIHPALLPRYGGKGFYGNSVHESVIKEGDKQSGITVHYVDEQFDSGEIIFQAECDISENETAESLAQKIHKMEYEHYPKVIEQLIDNK